MKKLTNPITDLERVYPFADYNYGTFAIYMINKELIKTKIMQSVMEDLNNFDFVTIKESVHKIKKV